MAFFLKGFAVTVVAFLFSLISILSICCIGVVPLTPAYGSEPPNQAQNVALGNVNGDEEIDLVDVILALQLAAGFTPEATIYKTADVNQDEKIGLEEAIFNLQVVSQIRETAEETFTNSLEMTFKSIPAGAFDMGSPVDELGRYSDENQHWVTLTQPFCMQTTEVTQGQWRAVMGSNPAYFQNCGDDCPVEQVSWDDIQTFIAVLNTRGEGIYRLPTEAEWEYAARAGSTTALANGDITVTDRSYDPNLDAVGWYGYNSCVSYTGGYNCSSWGGSCSTCGTNPVAQKHPNAWGLYDMHGNVWEWCQDWYATYPSGSVTDPAGPTSGSFRVLRGGCWFISAGRCRSAYRSSSWPANRSYYIGFRLVLPQVQ